MISFDSKCSIQLFSKPQCQVTIEAPDSHSTPLPYAFAEARTLACAFRTSKRACINAQKCQHTAPQRGQNLVGPVHPSWITWSPPTPEPPPNHQVQNRIIPTCFLSLITLNLSKSVRARLFCLRSRFFAHALSSHFLSTSSFSHAFLRAPVPSARGSFGITMGESMTFARAEAWRGTEALSFVEGPSTRTWKVILTNYPVPIVLSFQAVRTRL